MVNWKVGDANLRLMAAILAVHSIKVDLNAVALAYGRGATVRAIGHQITHVRELSKALNEEVQRSGLKRAPRGAEQDASSEPQTPRAKAPRSGSTTASGTGKGKRKRNAIEDSVERLTNPIRGSRVKTEQDDDEDMDLPEIQDQTPCKRARKPAQRREVAANQGSGSDENDGLYDSSADQEYAPDGADSIEHDGNADSYVLPEGM